MKLPRATRQLIVGGHNIKEGRYPYFVSIDKNNGVIVNGALIAPDIVLSAGHIALNHMDNLTIKVGPYAVHKSESFAETIPAKSWIVPSNWSQPFPGFFSDDYMIVQLEYPSTHQPIKLNRDPAEPSAGKHVVMVGLGWLNETYLSPANITQEVELVAIGNDDCEAKSDPLRKLTYKGKIDASMLCTVAPPNTTRDGCAWDSGAPVIVKGATQNEDILVALGSSGVGCADKVFPATQARVATDFGLHWVREQVCRLSVDPPVEFGCGSANHSYSSPLGTTTSAAALVGHAPEIEAGQMSLVNFLIACLLAGIALMVQRNVLRNRIKVTLSPMEEAGFDSKQSAHYGSINC